MTGVTQAQRDALEADKREFEQAMIARFGDFKLCESMVPEIRDWIIDWSFQNPTNQVAQAVFWILFAERDAADLN